MISQLAGVIIIYNLIYSVIGSAYCDNLNISLPANPVLVGLGLPIINSLLLIAAPNSLKDMPRIEAPYSHLRMPITRVSKDKSYGGNLCFYITNINLLDGEDIIKAIYTTLFNNSDFINYSYYKIIIIEGIMSHISAQVKKVSINLSFNNSLLINNDTTFEKFYEGMCSNLADNYDPYEEYVQGLYSELVIQNSTMGDNNYSLNVYSEFIIRVLNVDSLRNKNIRIYISPVTGLPTAEVTDREEL